MKARQKAKSSAEKRTAKKKEVPSTRRSTGGPGFDFEDRVAAHFVLSSLAGRTLPVEGNVQRLQMQTGTLQWNIDDLLVYKATVNIRAIRILLGHSRIENTVRYLGVDVEDALLLAERTEI